MMRAIRRLGEYSLEQDDLTTDDAVTILVENPASSDQYKHVFSIKFVWTEDGNKWEYENVEHEELDEENYEKYLYKFGSPRGTDISPTSKITSPTKTFNNKIFKWFEDYQNYKITEQVEQSQKKLVSDSFDELEKNKDEILVEIKQLNDSISDSAILTTVFKKNEKRKYNLEIEVFKEIMKEKALKKYWQKTQAKVTNAVSKGQTQCSICFEKNIEVNGFVDTFKFYTNDKPGYIVGGMHPENAWKNNPVCPNCALVLKTGRDYLENKLKFEFYGFNYFLIPKFNLEKSHEDVLMAMEQWRDPEFKEGEAQLFTDDENEIFQYLKSEKDNMTLTFLFYEEAQGAFNINLMLEDVLPSRFSKMFKAKEKIQNIDIIKWYNDQVLSSEREPLRMNFGILRTFFPYKWKNQSWVGHKEFFEMVEKIVGGTPVSYDVVLNRIVKKLRKTLRQDPVFIQKLVFEGFLLLEFLNELELIELSPTEVNEMASKVEKADGLSEEVENFFLEHDDFFEKPAQRAIYLQGVLTEKLLNVQYASRGSKPFFSRLRNLDMDQRKIRKLLPEIKAKLVEYDADYYHTIEELIAQNFIEAGNDWDLTKDEINFCYVLGMKSANYFKSSEGDDEDE